MSLRKGAHQAGDIIGYVVLVVKLAAKNQDVSIGQVRKPCLYGTGQQQRTRVHFRTTPLGR